MLYIYKCIKVGLVVPAKSSALTAELRVAKILERDLTQEQKNTVTLN